MIESPGFTGVPGVVARSRDVFGATLIGISADYSIHYLCDALRGAKWGPRAGLARRCGPELVATLDRALGRVPDQRAPYLPPPRYEGRLALPAPVHDAAALGFAVNRLVHELSAWLLARSASLGKAGRGCVP